MNSVGGRCGSYFWAERLLIIVVCVFSASCQTERTEFRDSVRS